MQSNVLHVYELPLNKRTQVPGPGTVCNIKGKHSSKVSAIFVYMGMYVVMAYPELYLTKWLVQFYKCQMFANLSCFILLASYQYR